MLVTRREEIWMRGFNDLDTKVWTGRITQALETAAQYDNVPVGEIGRALFFRVRLLGHKSRLQ